MFFFPYRLMEFINRKFFTLYLVKKTLFRYDDI